MEFIKEQSFVNQILFPAPSPTYSKATMFNQATLVNLDSGSNGLSTYGLSFFSPKNRYWLLYFHGNCCDVGSMYPHLLHMHNYTKANVLAVEYYGYGISKMSKDMSETRAYFLAKKAWNYLVKTLGVPPRNIILFGRSIGTGIASYLADVCRDVGGLILHSPFTSIRSLAYQYIGCANVLVFDRFNTLQRMRNYKRPLLVIHADKDEVVPLSHGIEVYEEANLCDKIFFLQKKASHNTFNVEEYLSAVKNFLGFVNTK